MNKPTEKHIERYIRYPSDLSREEKTWIRDWIDTDEETALLAEWYKDFYTTVEQIESNKEKSRSIPPVIYLKPFENRSKYSNGFVLAAQTPVAGRQKSSLKTIKTFVSEKHKTLIRILHEDSKHQSKLYIISEYVSDDDVVLIEVSDESLFLVSQPGGTFVIPDHKISKNKITDWSQCKLHLPVSSVEIFKNRETGNLNFDTSGIDRETQQIDFETEDDQLNIKVDFGDKSAPEKLVLHVEDQSTMWIIGEGTYTIPLEEISGSKARLYFYN